MRLREKYGAWALITGASSGIGRAYAEYLASEGIDLILVARREERLQVLSEELRKDFGINVVFKAVDLSKEGFIDEIEDAVNGKEIAILINNAGFGNNDLFHEADPDREADMVKLNCLAPIIISHRFIPDLIQRSKNDGKRGAVIFLSSIAANQPSPRNTTYAATKVFDQYLGESLYYELKPFNIDAISVLPGPTSTEFQANADYNDFRNARRPEDVVKTTFKALGRKAKVVDGFMNKVMTVISRFAPRGLVIRLAYKWTRMYYEKRDEE